MSDDLTGLLLPPPPGPAQPMSYRQGVVLSWNEITLQNTVRVGGSIMTDLPVLGVGEATTIRAGSVVGIMTVGSTWAILGRIVTPNTAEATNAVALLNSMIYADSLAAQEASTVTAFGDLATFGPSVTVSVRGTGRLLLIITCQMQWTVGIAGGIGGFASVEMSGANSMDALTAKVKLLLTSFFDESGVDTNVLQSTNTCAAVFEGLNPGTTTIAMKYASQFAGVSVDFGRRNIIAIAL